MTEIMAAEALALKRAQVDGLGVRVYVALARLSSWGKVVGPRRETLTILVGQIGPVASLMRPLQHQELVRVICNLAFAGVVDDRSDALVFDVVLLPRISN
ncbi:hypothetical protein [Chitinolyticbacter meiyuanensis]|uniref:hypothetical protein n=1 Tax=Chitinolyticbacter meiyuanensis TaxID=682798 RepID=UPI0011E5F7FD|nr:hypothetical protein [Chitinolyticbacter meiyuanensis]